MPKLKRGERAVFFNVRERDSCALTWECLTPGRGKSDIYISARNLRQAFKMSLHEKTPEKEGQWRTAFERSYLDGHAPQSEWPNRTIQVWERPPDIVPGLKLAVRIVVPAFAVNRPIEPATASDSTIIWFDSPPRPLATEFDIAIAAPGIRLLDWPEKDRGSALIATLPIDDGSTVWITAKPTEIPQSIQLPIATTRLFNEAQLHEGNRACLFGSEPDGSRVIYDLAVEVATPLTCPPETGPT